MIRESRVKRFEIIRNRRVRTRIGVLWKLLHRINRKVASCLGGMASYQRNALSGRFQIASSMRSFASGSCLAGAFLFRKSYATASQDDSDPHYDFRWPKKANPTPYDLFDMGIKADGSEIDAKALKKKYHEYARLYHPDISQNIRIIRSPIDQLKFEKNLLTLDEKLHRFKATTQAYEILSDPKKKKLYDFTQSGWSFGPSGSSSGMTGQHPGTHGYRSDSTYAYWNAGTWEDHHDMKAEKEPIDVWTLFLWLCGLVICVQATALLTRIEDSLTSNRFTHDETEHDLTQSYTNYGLDTDKISRLRRFLWFRAYGLYRTNADLDREAKKNEELVQSIMNKKEKKATTEARPTR